MAVGRNAVGTLNGIGLHSGVMVAVEPGEVAQLVVEKGYESVGYLVPPQQLRDALARWRNVGLVRLPKGIEIRAADPGATKRFFNLGKRIATAAARSPEGFNASSEIRATARRQIIERLFSAAEKDLAAYQPTREDRRRQAYDQIVQIAEHHVMENPDQPGSVYDLCQAAGVSERTLQYAFKKVMGMSPTTYLTRLRLHYACDELRRHHPRSTTVSKVAMRWGFWHWGDFARVYREYIGELPSETLRKN